MTTLYYMYIANHMELQQLLTLPVITVVNMVHDRVSPAQ